MFRTQVVSPVLCTHHEPSIPMPLGHAEQILSTSHLGLGMHTQQALLASRGTDVNWAQPPTLLYAWLQAPWLRHTQFLEANLSQENLSSPLWDLGSIKPYVSPLYSLAPPLLLQIPTLHRYNISPDCRKWLQYGYKWIYFYSGGEGAEKVKAVTWSSAPAKVPTSIINSQCQL